MPKRGYPAHWLHNGDTAANVVHLNAGNRSRAAGRIAAEGKRLVSLTREERRLVRLGLLLVRDPDQARRITGNDVIDAIALDAKLRDA